MPDAPLCHVIEHAGRAVVYDVHTSRLVAVDPVLADVLRGCSHGHPADAVARAEAEIETAGREEGLFRIDRPPLAAVDLSAADSRALTRGQRHLTLSLTEDCNLRCRYCLHGSDLTHVRPHRPRGMPTATALAAVAAFLDAAVDEPGPAISFYGGEPLLAWPVITDVVRAVRRRSDGHRVRFAVDTNGLALDRPEVAELIHREGLHLQVSLDGPAAVHDRHRVGRQGQASHARIEANLTALLRTEPALADRLALVATLAPPFDLEAVDAYFADFPPLRAAGLARRPLLRANRADVTGLDLEPDQTWPEQLQRLRDRYVSFRGDGRHDDVTPLAAALFDDPLIRWHHRSAAPLDRGVGRGGCCLPGVRRLHVRADGLLQPCERVGQGMTLGTVATGLAPRRLRDLRERFRASYGRECRSCWAVRLCSMCYHQLLPEGGNGSAPCEAVRERAEATIRLYLDLRAQGPQALQWLEKTSVE